MDSWQYILLFVSALAGGGIAYYIRKTHFQQHHLFLSFSGAYLFSIIVLHLIPEIYRGQDERIGIYVLVGFFIQIILEQLSHGIEHGHLHIHEGEEHSPAYIYGLLLGLSVHAFMEGIPLGGNPDGGKTHYAFLYGISLHKIPEAFALMNILLHFKLHRLLPMALLVLFACISPFAAGLTQYLKAGESVLFSNYLPAMTAVVMGSFLHITTTILFESSTKAHRFTFLKILAILLGVVLSLLTL